MEYCTSNAGVESKALQGSCAISIVADVLSCAK